MFSPDGHYAVTSRAEVERNPIGILMWDAGHATSENLASSIAFAPS